MLRVTNRREVERLVKKWQKLLKLSDWDIEIEITNTVIAEDENLFIHAMTMPDVFHRQALIKFYNPLQKEVEGWEYDIEKTVVHELLHLVLEPFTARECGEINSPSTIPLEQSINMLTELLVEGYKD